MSEALPAQTPRPCGADEDNEIGMSQKSLLYLLPRPRAIAALSHMQHDDCTKNMTIVLDSIETNRRRGGKGSPIPGERERERENIEVHVPRYT